ncbi:hypothetical protein [Prevotella sp. MGM2]|uniref:hypothetical protein n=1 Tax=Prevotella sp. MGM2 TaxID=2033406 RepID=UPI000CEA38B8|nr:hypothetical protein [Prevotella sp. MGM2]GAY30625.1 hypothetical protein PvtlMGM2_1478 [Prevotella sp. MGM2]
MKTSICVKSFPGFYETIFDERYIESDQRDQLYELYKGFKHLDDWELPESYRSEVAKEFAEMYISELNDKLGLKMELTSESVESPREYNFTTDQVICFVEVGDWDGFVKKVSSLMSQPEYTTELAKIIKENHSDRPGFWSFMSNDIEYWYGAILDPDNTNYLECVLWYLYCLKSGESIYNDGDWNMAEQIYEELSCSRDTMNLIPITDEANKEWEEWRDKEEANTGLH